MHQQPPAQPQQAQPPYTEWKPTRGPSGKKVALLCAAGAVGLITVFAVIGHLAPPPATKAAAPASPSPQVTASAAPRPVATKKPHPARTKAAAKKPPPAAADPNANIPGFSGAVDPAGGHIFGRCLHSSWTSTGSGLSVHVGYPGPALINVDVMMQAGFDPPSGVSTHQDFTMPTGQDTQDVTFPAIPHVDYVQINVASNAGSLTCDAAGH